MSTDMPSGRIFVDTNVLISAVANRSPHYFHARGLLSRIEQGDVEAWISRQVLREVMSGMSRPQAFARPFLPAEILQTVQEYEAMFVVAEDQPIVTQQLYLLLGQIAFGGKQVYDANIVATMIAYSIPRLVTYNVEDFRRFAGLIQVSDEA